MPGPDDFITLETVSIVAGAVCTTAYLTWFISRQFGSIRSLVYRIISAHNKEDDDRFEGLSNDIWRIHVRNARIDGDDPPQRKTFPRRRYLSEESES